MDRSNNASERNMKRLVSGQKNWLFSTSPAGARSTAIWLTLIESAKANGIDPRAYITYLLKELPQQPDFSKSRSLVVFLKRVIIYRLRKIGGKNRQRLIKRLR